MLRSIDTPGGLREWVAVFEEVRDLEGGKGLCTKDFRDFRKAFLRKGVRAVLCHKGFSDFGG